MMAFSLNDDIRILKSKTRLNISNTYAYFPDNKMKGQIQSISGPENVSQSFVYDSYGRNTQVTESIQGDQSFSTNLTYDNWNNPVILTYPSGFSTTNEYNNGYLTTIRKSDNSIIWKADSINSLGQPVQFTLGSSLSQKFAYDYYGKLLTKRTGNCHQAFAWDDTLNNVLERRIKRQGAAWKSETFTYDSKNRLTISDAPNQPIIYTSYDTRGNITSKSGIGEYYYNGTMVNRLDSISPDTSYDPIPEHTIAYTSENLTSSITQDPYHLEFLYGPTGQRIKTVLTENGDTIKTKYFSPNYEKDITGSGVKELHYLYSPYGLFGVMIKQGTTENMYFAETDHLGSVISLINSNGTYAEKYLYDVWGRRRNPDSWSYDSIPSPLLIDRGFTGHEHLDEFDLINMNGRMYDPYIGRFLGVDPFIQFPGNSQNFNGYGYCLNNPLKYTDPSGYLMSAAAAYQAAREKGYVHSYAYFISDYYQQYFDIYFDSMLGDGGGSGRGGSYSMTFQYVGGHSETGKNNDYSEGCVWVKDKYVSSVTIDVGNFGFAGSFNIAPSSGGNNGNINYTTGPYTSWTGVIGQVAQYSNKEIPSLAVKTVGKYATRIGWGGEIVSNAVNVVNISRNPTWGNYGRLGVSLGTTATNLIPYAGPGISFGLSALDAEGSFNNFYDFLDQDQSFYKSTGYVIVPSMTGGFSILKLRK
ncbi:MAG: RHS repeat-associated core domain-containing protein [Bacteroidetes bacterium]|nr:MAG: RHS repeat-associated core domain-containing protein [Bacteroidota bacterium]